MIELFKLKKIGLNATLFALWAIYIVFAIFDDRLNLIRNDLVMELIFLSGSIILITVIVSQLFKKQYIALCYLSSIIYSGSIMYWRWTNYNASILKIEVFFAVCAIVTGVCYSMFFHQETKSFSYIKSIGISSMVGLAVFIVATLTVFFHLIS